MNGVAVPSSFVFSAGNDCKDCMHQWVKNCGTDLDRLLHQLLCGSITLLTSPKKLGPISMVWTSPQWLILCTILGKELLVTILSPKLSRTIQGQITWLSFVTVPHLLARRKCSA
jgi:hypothetical protein